MTLYYSPEQQYAESLQQVHFKPVFILGDHRSGTTLLYKTLAATNCFNYVTAYHVINYNRLLSIHAQGKDAYARQELEKVFESHDLRDRGIDHVQLTPDLPEEYGFILDNAGYGFRLSQDSLPVFIELCKKIQLVGASDKPLLLKNPWDSSNFLQIKENFPDCKIIFIQRDAAEVISSKLKAMRVLLAKENAYTTLLSQKYGDIFKSPIKKYLYQLYYSGVLGLGLRQFIKETIESRTYYSQNISRLDKSDYISITYEGLCKSPRETILGILEFLGLEEVNPLDYESLIKPRPLNLLPEVVRKKNEINQKLQFIGL